MNRRVRLTARLGPDAEPEHTRDVGQDCKGSRLREASRDSVGDTICLHVDAIRYFTEFSKELGFLLGTRRNREKRERIDTNAGAFCLAVFV
jgi:hypothetical protein